jgi:hypothetical protein
MYLHAEVRQGFIPHFRLIFGGFVPPERPFRLNGLLPKTEHFKYLRNTP